MTITELFEMCENLKNIEDIMLYDTVYDFDNSTSLWKSCKYESVRMCNIRVAKFRIYKGFVAIAMK